MVILINYNNSEVFAVINKSVTDSVIHREQ